MDHRCHLHPSTYEKQSLCPPISLGVFRVSKQLYEEALAVFFSFNKFFVSLSSRRSLQWLVKCQRNVLQSVRSLRISFSRGMSAALSHESQAGTELITLWEAACAYLGANLTPGLVRFSLYCVVRNELAATRTVSPLELLPIMATCKIELGPGEDKNIQAIARKYVQKLMRRDEEQFPIERLPSTLRSRVLFYTDLVSRPRSGCDARSGKMQIFNGRFLHPPSECCGKCSDVANQCVCITKPSAISSTCQCALVPVCLIWLSRSLSDEAISTFYLQNKFLFLGDLLKNLDMLKRMPDSSVKLIRHLHYEMDERLLEKLMDPYHAVHAHWSMFIAFVRDNFNLSRLHFHISTEDFWDFGRMRNPGYKKAVILTPLRGLQGLRGASLDIPSLSVAEKEEAERAMVGPRYVPLTEEERQRVTRGEDAGD